MCGGDCWIENKTIQGKDKWGGTSTDAHHCAGISDARLEEEVIHGMAGKDAKWRTEELFKLEGEGE